MSKLGRNPFAGAADPKSSTLKSQAPQPVAARTETPSKPRMRGSSRADRGLCPAARQAVRLAAGAVVLGFKGTILAREAIRTTFGL